MKTAALFAMVAALFIGTGFVQSWNTSLSIFNMGLISAILALGVNMQWGFAGLFNVGVMGFVALGGLATVLVTMPATPGAFAAGGIGVALSLVIGAATVALAMMVSNRLVPGRRRTVALLAVIVVGFIAFRWLFDPSRDAIEGVDPAAFGYLGGLDLPERFGWLPLGGVFASILAWLTGGVIAAGAAWLVGKTALGLRSDYLAIATLGIAEIIIAVIKNEDWLSRGVKNVVGLPRPVPYEIDLQNTPAFVDRMTSYGLDPVSASAITVKLAYSGLFSLVLLTFLWLVQMALKSPWGRMMRAIRDNETAAEAMGKNVTRRHLQIFILGSAICGFAGAMMTTLDGQFTPGSYQPLRFTFLVWVMVIVGGSGNNWGAVLGGFLIWWLWVQVEPIGALVMQGVTYPLADGSALKTHLIDSVQHMRLLTMGLILLAVLRFSPRGLIPER
jgi:branched-chain amino acid transport system permease protein